MSSGFRRMPPPATWPQPVGRARERRGSTENVGEASGAGEVEAVFREVYAKAVSINEELREKFIELTGVDPASYISDTPEGQSIAISLVNQEIKLPKRIEVLKALRNEEILRFALAHENAHVAIHPFTLDNNVKLKTAILDIIVEEFPGVVEKTEPAIMSAFIDNVANLVSDMIVNTAAGYITGEGSGRKMAETILKYYWRPPRIVKMSYLVNLSLILASGKIVRNRRVDVDNIVKTALKMIKDYAEENGKDIKLIDPEIEATLKFMRRAVPVLKRLFRDIQRASVYDPEHVVETIEERGHATAVELAKLFLELNPTLNIKEAMVESGLSDLLEKLIDEMSELTSIAPTEPSGEGEEKAPYTPPTRKKPRTGGRSRDEKPGEPESANLEDVLDASPQGGGQGADEEEPDKRSEEDQSSRRSAGREEKEKRESNEEGAGGRGRGGDRDLREHGPAGRGYGKTSRRTVLETLGTLERIAGAKRTAEVIARILAPVFKKMFENVETMFKGYHVRSSRVLVERNPWLQTPWRIPAPEYNRLPMHMKKTRAKRILSNGIVRGGSVPPKTIVVMDESGSTDTPLIQLGGDNTITVRTLEAMLASAVVYSLRRAGGSRQVTVIKFSDDIEIVYRNRYRDFVPEAAVLIRSSVSGGGTNILDAVKVAMKEADRRSTLVLVTDMEIPKEEAEKIGDILNKAVSSGRLGLLVLVIVAADNGGGIGLSDASTEILKKRLEKIPYVIKEVKDMKDVEEVLRDLSRVVDKLRHGEST